MQGYSKASILIGRLCFTKKLAFVFLILCGPHQFYDFFFVELLHTHLGFFLSSSCASLVCGLTTVLRRAGALLLICVVSSQPQMVLNPYIVSS